MAVTSTAQVNYGGFWKLTGDLRPTGSYQISRGSLTVISTSTTDNYVFAVSSSSNRNPYLFLSGRGYNAIKFVPPITATPTNLSLLFGRNFNHSIHVEQVGAGAAGKSLTMESGDSGVDDGQACGASAGDLNLGGGHTNTVCSQGGPFSGGNVNIYGGNVELSGGGGFVNITGGSGDIGFDGGNGGNVVVNGGASASGTNGNVILANLRGMVGISTGVPATTLDVNGIASIRSTITILGPIISSGTGGGLLMTGPGTRFMWIPSSASLRAGSVTSGSWDQIPGHSYAFGLDPLLDVNSPYSSILGGSNNSIGGEYSVISGGYANLIESSYSHIGGGSSNEASAQAIFVGGGSGNTASSIGAVIGGGASNAATGSYSALVGGAVNSATGNFSFIGGGTNTIASGFSASVVGGSTNTASGNFSFVGGGSSNVVSGVFSTIGGGTKSIASAYGAVVVGGDNNAATGIVSNVGGGRGNQATGTGSTVAGGLINFSTGTNTNIGGGNNNHATGTNSTIAGGSGNYSTGINSYVGGGLNNVAQASRNTVSGGFGNRAFTSSSIVIAGGASNTANATFSVISGGSGNTVSGQQSLIAGGLDNIVEAPGSIIGGGSNNYVQTAVDGFSTISGGSTNNTIADYSTIGGGSENVVTGEAAVISGGGTAGLSGIGTGNFAVGMLSTIPGGTSNRTYGDFSFAAGHSAEATAKGSFVWADSQGTALTNRTTDQFLLRAQGGFQANTSSLTIVGTPGNVMFSVSASSTSSPGNQFYVGGSSFVVIGSSVGIRTATPAAMIHASSGSFLMDGPVSAFSVFLQNNAIARFYDASGASAIWGANGGVVSEASQMKLSSIAGSTMSFHTGGTRGSMTEGTERMRLKDSNLGINNINPSALLHISSGTLIVDGTAPTVKIGTMTVGPTSPPQSQALCFIGGQLGYCTSVVGITGGCTCAAP